MGERPLQKNYEWADTTFTKLYFGPQAQQEIGADPQELGKRASAE